MTIYKEEKHRTILEATEGELIYLKNKSKDSIWKPRFHIHPEYGLLNDPNGLAYFNGKYHVFHQWYPFGATHGMKHWAHLESKDLVNWERLPVALIPTESYESHGAYSGNAIEVEGELYLYYTGNVKYNSDDRSANQCLAIMDRLGNIRKCEKNPIIKGVPVGYTGHVRDPKVFKVKDSYYMILGAQRENKTGTLIVYKSENAIDWSFSGELKLENFHDEEGYMWECPDYINIDGKDVLILSLQGISSHNHRYKNIFSVVYAVGSFDFERLKFNVESYEELDKGFDFYAPQSFKGKEGENLLLAWAGMGEFSYPTDSELWAHCLTFPRELSIEGNKLIQRPSKSIEKLIKANKRDEGIAFNSKEIENSSNSYYLKLELSSLDEVDFGVKLFSSDIESLSLNFNKKKSVVTLNRENLNHSFAKEYGLSRSIEIKIENTVTIELLVDNSIVEIFINDGKEVMTTRAFPLENSKNIEIYGGNKLKYNYIKYDLISGI